MKGCVFLRPRLCVFCGIHFHEQEQRKGWKRNWLNDEIGSKDERKKDGRKEGKISEGPAVG